jgi:hypothetical protein
MQGNYGEFMSQYIMDSFLGETMQPNRSNPVTLRRKLLKQQIGNNPKAAFTIVRKNIPRLDKYIISKGERPLENVFEKSVQAYLLKNKEIADVSKTLNIQPDDAQTFLDEAEAKGHNIEHPDTDSFIGDIIGAIAQVAQPAINQIAAKRASQGLPAGIFGTLATGGTQAYNTVRGLTPQQVQNLAAGGTANDPNAKGGTKDVLSTLKLKGQQIIDKVGDSERQKQLGKMLPVILIAVAVVGLVIFFAAKSAKK